tara:strand:+ start:205 stop:483 length:279 start_codon:yes stop_codon:yes gene_type:complete
MQSGSILLKNARLADVIDLAGQLLLPSLVDGLTHLDMTLWGLPWRPHAAGDARSSRIDTEIAERRTLVMKAGRVLVQQPPAAQPPPLLEPRP